GETGFETLPGSFVPGHGTTIEPHSYSFLDVAPPIRQMRYRLKQIDFDGTVHYTEPIQVDILTSVTPSEVPLATKLYQNYPNPFNPTTSIRFDVAEKGRVVLTIHDILGRKVTTLVDDERVAGKYSIDWSAQNFANGVYFYRLQAGKHMEVSRLTLLK
ncbi:MAG TPA: T9SS type A sorting domain-containing protein, partial [Bacteroidota bacterium]